MILTQDMGFKVKGFKLRLSTGTSGWRGFHCAISDIDPGCSF
jgi:hypothetical protein